MCQLLLAGDRYFEIRGGIVYSRTPSGESGDTICWPIAEFRAHIADGARLLAKFDAEHTVLMLRG